MGPTLRVSSVATDVIPKCMISGEFGTVKTYFDCWQSTN